MDGGGSRAAKTHAAFRLATTLPVQHVCLFVLPAAARAEFSQRENCHQPGNFQDAQLRWEHLIF
jgi:hypothetical protein